MTNCNQIKRLIDETEQPEVMPFEATHHLNACASCRMFADERASLRALLNGIPRVNAPINFDAQLKARMNTAKAKPAFSWLSPAFYLRFGAASAALLIAIFVAQYNGLFSPTSNIASTDNTPASAPGQIASVPRTDTKDPAMLVKQSSVPVTPRQVGTVAVVSPRGNHRVSLAQVKVEDNSMSDKVRGFIVRPPSGPDIEVGMLPVSIGAQQRLMNRSSRAPVQQPVAFQSF